MDAREITRQRLLSQHVAQPRLRSARDLVFRLGAMQSQDYGMGTWAVGVRLAGATERTVEAAVEAGQIIRMHLLRPTWHFAAREDVRWMLELTGPNIRASMRYRDKQLELTDEIVRRSNRVLERAMKAGPVPREKLVAALEAAGISNYDNRAAHLLMRAELDRVACCAAPVDGKQAYRLFDQWVPPAEPLPRDEALARLAQRYFESRCPATVHDFAWWSGLSLKDARAALEMVKAGFATETVGSRIWVLCRSSRRPRASEEADGTSPSLLPAYDEMVLSYADRTALLAAKDHVKAVLREGVIRPVIIMDHRAVGTWRRTTDEKKVTVTIEPFGRLPAAARASTRASTKASIEKAVQRYAAFLGKSLALEFPTRPL